MKKIIIMIVLLFTTMNVLPNGSKSNSQRYLEKYDCVAVELMKEYKIPASVIIGISMLESGHGTSNVSKTKNNFFGIRKGYPYKVYKKDTESFVDFCKVISRKDYYKELTDNKIMDPYVWVDKISDGGYAESEYWNPRVKSCIESFDLISKLDNNTYLYGLCSNDL